MALFCQHLQLLYIILHFHRLERWVIYLCSTKVFYRTGKIYAFIISMMVLEYKKSTFFSPLDEQSCFIDYIFFPVYIWIFHEGRRQKKNSILFSPTSSIFYLPHGSQMKIQEKKRKREQRKNFSFFVFSLVLFAVLIWANAFFIILKWKGVLHPQCFFMRRVSEIIKWKTRSKWITRECWLEGGFNVRVNKAQSSLNFSIFVIF